MQRPTRWVDLAGLQVGVWGLGTEGHANLRRLEQLGVQPVVVDDRPVEVDGEPVLVTAQGGIDALLGCDVVVKTPGVSRYRDEVTALETSGVPVVGGLGLWLAAADPDRVVCITGTKGKSTTTEIAAHLASALGFRVFAGGNLGTPPHAPEAPDDVDFWFIEVSSYQACDIDRAPKLAAVTSLYPDHLPWHGSVDRYYADKLSLTRAAGVETVLAARGSDLSANAHRLGGRVEWIDEATFETGWADDLGLLGGHNRANANIARRALQLLGITDADDDERMAAACQGFSGLEHRLQIIAELSGVTFVDDGLSTNVLPTIAALDAFPGKRVALLVGGMDRKIDYTPLAEHVGERAWPTLVIPMFESGPEIATAMREIVGGANREVVPCPTLESAVEVGAAWAQPDGVVLLSPAAASFDAFRDYRHRSEVFANAVAALEW